MKTFGIIAAISLAVNAILGLTLLSKEIKFRKRGGTKPSQAETNPCTDGGDMTMKEIVDLCLPGNAPSMSELEERKQPQPWDIR